MSTITKPAPKQPPASTAVKPTALFQPHPKLREGDTHPDVAILTRELDLLGYAVSASSTDVFLGDDDSAENQLLHSALVGAVKRFQRDAGLPATGVVEARTWKVLDTLRAQPELGKVVAFARLSFARAAAGVKPLAVVAPPSLPITAGAMSLKGMPGFAGVGARVDAYVGATGEVFVRSLAVAPKAKPVWYSLGTPPQPHGRDPWRELFNFQPEPGDFTSWA